MNNEKTHFKIIIIRYVSLFLVTILFSQYSWCQQPIWANTIATTLANSSNQDMDTDNNGNVITVGGFTGTVDFDPGAGVVNKTAVGISTGAIINSYILKYDANGNFQWVIHIENDGSITAVDCDANGNIYVVGGFRKRNVTYDMDPGPGTANLTSVSGNNGFVAKYDANGNYVWAFMLGTGLYPTQTESIKVENSELAVVGYFADTVDFDPGIGTTNLISKTKGGNSRHDAFVAKYDLNSNFIWARSIENSQGGNCTGRAMAMNSSGEVVIKGFFVDSVYFDPAAIVPDLIVPPSEKHACLIKYDTDGNYLWFGDVDLNFLDPTNRTETIEMDDDGNVYLTGYMKEVNDFDPGAGVQNLTPHGKNDGFLAKYDPSGNYLWAFNFGDMGSNTGSNIAYAMELDTCDNIYIGGHLDGTIDMDPSSDDAIVSVSDAYFLAKYSVDGDFAWVQHQDVITGSDDSWMTSMAVTGPQNVIIGLNYYGDPDLDKGAGDFSLAPSNTPFFDLAIAMLEPLPPDVPTVTAPPTVCSGGPTTLTITAGELNSATNWYWYEGSCGGTFVGKGKSIQVNPTSATTYFVRGEGKCILPGSCGQITVTPGPPGATAAFSFTTNCSGEVSLQDESTGPVTIHSWDFGDMQGTSSNQNPTYTYNQEGSYDIQLLVETAAGCKDSITKTAILFRDQTVFDTITICPSQLPYSIHGVDRSTAGTYENTLTVNGCDSTSSVTLKVNDAIENQITITGCDSTEVDGQWYSNNIELRDTIIGGAHTGCDSIVIRQIRVNNAVENRITFSECDSIQVDGQWYFNDTELRDTIVGGAHTGCDSIVIKQIQVFDGPNLTITTDNDTIIMGNEATLEASGANSYTWNNGASGNQIIVTPNSNTTYCVTGTTAGNCNATLCINIGVTELICEKNMVFIPNGISPNNDGRNDELCVFGSECLRDEIVLEIYDRWGNQVFYSEDKKACWDGTYNGKELDNAVFIFRFNGELLNGELIPLAGNITILK